MKRITAVFLAFLLVISAAGCAGINKTTGEEKLSTVVFYFLGDPDQSDVNEVYAKANEIFKERYGIEVEFHPISSSNYNDKLNMIMASGEYYDVCWTSNWSNNYIANATGGAYLELDDYLEQDMPKVKDIFNENIWDAVRVHGKIYGVPIQQIFARAGGAEIPEEYYDEYAHYITDGQIRSYRDFTPYLEAVSKLAPGQANVALPFSSTLLPFYGWEAISGIDIGAVAYGDKTAKVFNQYETPEFRDAVKTRKEWADKGYTINGLIVGEQGGESPQTTPIMFMAYKPGIEIMNKPPGFDVKGFKLTDAYLSTSGVLGTLYAISSGSKNVEGSVKLIEALNTDAELGNLLTYGIEGKHYTKLSDTMIRVAENPGFSNYNWCVGNIFNLYVTEGLPENVWEETKKMNDEAIPSELLGFSIDINPIAIEVNNCSSVLNEYLSIVQSGVGDTEKSLDEMLAKLKQAGSDKVIAEIQKQVDAWLAAR